MLFKQLSIAIKELRLKRIQKKSDRLAKKARKLSKEVLNFHSKKLDEIKAAMF